MKKSTQFILILVMLSSVAFAQKTWTGATSTAWNTSTNWNPAGAPTASDNVTIPSAPVNQPLINGTITPVCNNLNLNSGATLTISATNLNNATLTASGNVFINGNLSIGGTVTKTGKLIAANITWASTASLAAYFNSRMEVTGNWEFLGGSSINMGLCFVTFPGSTNSNIISKSSNSSFSSVSNAKDAGYSVYISAASTATLNITGSLILNTGTKLYGEASITTILGSGITNSGNFYFNAGTVSFEKASGTQIVQINSGDYFNALKINGGATVSINNNVFIHDDFIIQSGIFDAVNYTVNVGGDWINTAGPDSFIEGTGKVIFLFIVNKDGGKAFDHYCNNSEDFNVLEIRNEGGGFLIINSASAIVTCNQYDWTAGGIKVQEGTFTALDLADNAIYGNFYLETGGTINLTNSDSYVDLSGNLTISGGNFNVYGGLDQSYWPYNNIASITMSGGTLNFADQSIRVQASTLLLTSNITGGTIKTSKNFSNYRSDFNPTGGTIEMYGPTDANLYCVGTAALYGLKINKTASKDGSAREITYPSFDRETGEIITDETRALIVNLTSPVTLNGDFTLSSGTFNSNSYTIQAKRNWSNYAAAGSFVPGTGRVIFNGGNYHQICYNETFNILEVAKASGGAFRLNSGTVNCAQYDWTIGSIDVLGGTFTASDLYENGLYGGYYVNPGGTINLYQDIYQYVDLNGSLTFTNGGTINVFGGNGASQWASGANASVTMNAGTLDFKDWGITLTNLAPNTVTENITGGTIRTTGGFFCNRSDFTPAGGTLELYGSNDVTVEQYAGNLSGLKINKTLTDDRANVTTLGTNAVINGVLTIESGTLKATNKTLTTSDHININSGGTLWLENASQLKILGGKALTVNEGGSLKVLGLSGSKPIITRNGATSNHEIQINGTISAKYAVFEYNYGVNIWATAIIDPSYSFDQCTFQNGVDRFMTINNSQEITMHDVNFPTAPLYNNVWKMNDAGRITFRDATGAYAGAAYEYDPYNRIDWITTQPGLWTGAVSTNWHTAGNWDDNAVPTTTTNVTIPASAPNMPVITNGVANCQNLLINGTLTIGSPDVSVNGNMTVNGTLAMNHDAGRLFVYGDVNWNSGSNAAFTANSEILAYGSWYFNAGANATLNNGIVKFYGETTKYIRSQSSTCTFYNLSSYKTAGSLLGFSASSTSPLVINGTLTTTTGSRFVSYSGQDIVVKGNIVSYGTLQCTDGAVKLDGSDQYIMPNVNDYFNKLVFSQTGNMMISTTNANTLHVLDDLTIQSGIFIPGNTYIYVGGDWNNSVGSAAFNESTSTVVFNGSGNVQRIQTDENFLTLELNKPSGGLLEISNNAQVYSFFHHWTAGALSVVSGTYTAPNLTNGVMGGDIAVNSGGSITMGKTTSTTNLIGRLFITGGTFNLITNGDSQWPGNGNAQITMSGGELNVYPGGINIVNNPPNLFVTNITGGTIRTEGSFVNNRNDFNPTAGTVELYGPEDVILGYSTSTLYNLNNLIINKTSLTDNGGIVTLTGKILLRNLNIEKGTLNCASGNVIVLVEDADVKNEGKLSFEPNTAFGLYPSCQVSIYEGGAFESLGTESQPIVVDLWGSTGFYDFGVGGTISSRFTTFNNCGNLIVAPTGFIDPENAFYHCTFPVSVGPLLSIDNNQDISIMGAHFPNLPNISNVRKLFDTGRVTMIDATGPGAGSAYEYDPWNRIDWRASQPGLWTGIVSSDWHNPENWDDLSIPTYQTDVFIPEEAPHMPAVSAEANCKSITVMGEIAIFDNNLWISNNAHIYGHVNNDAGFRVFGDLYWHEGSTATFGEDGGINILGDWYFNPGANVNLTNGGVYFSGQAPSSIYVFSENCAFNKLQLMKDPGAPVNFNESSTYPLKINNNFLVMGGNEFFSNSAQDITINGNLSSQGSFHCENGRVLINGADQTITLKAPDYFNTLVFNQTGIATINTYHTNLLNIKKDLIIESGVFSPGNLNIKIEGDWTNNIGYQAFNEENSRVIFCGDGPQFSSSEHFNILELDKPDSRLYLQDNNTIICDIYDWTNGGIWIAGMGTFVANDLADDGIYGFIHLFEGNVELYQDAAQTVDLRGDLMISGGEFKVWGGIDQSQWGFSSNATLTMTGGILDFKDKGVAIQDTYPYSFTSTITNGTIRAKHFFAQSPGFYPTGGTVEIVSDDNSMVFASDGSVFYNLRIKSAPYPVFTNLYSSIINHHLFIEESSTSVPYGNTLTCGGIFVSNAGDFRVNPNCTLKMKSEASIEINDGCSFYIEGYEGAMTTITTVNTADHYSFTARYGSTLYTVYTVFENMDSQGIQIQTGANLLTWQPFKNCEFRNGAGGSSSLLSINNNNDYIIENAVFPTNTWGGQYNVRKTTDAGSVTFVNATGGFAGSDFENDPFNRIFWGDEFATHPISIPAGWSGISSYVIPNQPAMEDVFTPISNELIIAQTMTEMYFPGQNINTIGNWESHSAYKVKTSSACSLSIIGDYETDMTVSLNTGWNLLPVVTPDGAPAADLLSPVNGFVIAKDVAGTGIYWPEYGINTIEYLLPGKAYFVLLTENGVVDYSGYKSNSAGVENLSASLDLKAYNIQATPFSHTFAILPSAVEDIKPGTLIGAYDQAGNCFGMMEIRSENNCITAFGDDPTTLEKDGFYEGEMIVFKTLSGFQNLTGLEPTFDQTLPHSDGFFAENGLSAIIDFKASTGILGNNLLSSVKVFPNPSDGLVNISGIIPGTILAVSDLQGKDLMEIIVDSENTEFDLTDYQSGVYFIKISQNGNSIFRKIVLR